MHVHTITLSDAGIGDGSVTANRRFDLNSDFDAALWKFLFYWDLQQVRGLPTAEVDVLWKKHCGGADGR